MNVQQTPAWTERLVKITWLVIPARVWRATRASLVAKVSNIWFLICGDFIIAISNVRWSFLTLFAVMKNTFRYCDSRNIAVSDIPQRHSMVIHWHILIQFHIMVHDTWPCLVISWCVLIAYLKTNSWVTKYTYILLLSFSYNVCCCLYL